MLAVPPGRVGTRTRQRTPDVSSSQRRGGCAIHMPGLLTLQPRDRAHLVRLPPAIETHLTVGDERLILQDTHCLQPPHDRDMRERAAAVLAATDDRAEIVFGERDDDVDLLRVSRCGG